MPSPRHRAAYLSVSKESPPNGLHGTPDVGFVACIESGVLEVQAVRLFESIRCYAGRFAACPIYACSPRPGRAVSPQTRARLDELAVNYSDAQLNTDCLVYGAANRIAAGAHVESTTAHELLVVLDSDTLFLREPLALELPADVDVAARPVDAKGIATTGAGDPFDPYWRDLCRLGGVDYDAIPFRQSYIDRQRIKANYNGGLVVVRRALGVLQTCSRVFRASVHGQLRPNPNPFRFRAGAGWVEHPAGVFWGSSQAALAAAIWNTTSRISELPPAYNYPLHLHDKIDPGIRSDVFPRLVHVHYHWLLDDDQAAHPLFAQSGPLSSAQRDWLSRPSAASSDG